MELLIYRYDGKKGPEHWDKIPGIQIGNHQSPVDFVDDKLLIPRHLFVPQIFWHSRHSNPQHHKGYKKYKRESRMMGYGAVSSRGTKTYSMIKVVADHHHAGEHGRFGNHHDDDDDPYHAQLHGHQHRPKDLNSRDLSTYRFPPGSSDPRYDDENRYPDDDSRRYNQDRNYRDRDYKDDNDREYRSTRQTSRTSSSSSSTPTTSGGIPLRQSSLHHLHRHRHQNQQQDQLHTRIHRDNADRTKPKPAVDVHNTGTTVKISMPPHDPAVDPPEDLYGGFVVFEGKRYDLKQFHCK
jgi:hypothetical protein